MSHSYREDDMGIDVIPTFEAINLIHPHVSRVIQEMWADDEGVCIAGGDFFTVFFIQIIPYIQIKSNLTAES